MRAAWGWGRAAALAAVLCAASAAARSAENDAPVVPLSDEAREALVTLGEGVVGEALPATPIEEPARLRHLEPGTWTYRIVAGANRGQVQTVRVERVVPDERGGTWQVATDEEDIQRLRVTTEHEVIKLSQSDLQSDRTVVYRPGLVLDPGMQAGESKRVRTQIVTYKADRPDELEHTGRLEYTTRYLGAFRVSTPAGSFDARLLEHEYDMKIGPAKARHRSYGFYADDVGNVADVSEESVSALLVYRRSSRSARVLLTAPPR